MTTRLRADLEKRIQQWLDGNWEKPDFAGLDVWCHNNMAQDMATAAYTLFMACVQSQTEREE